MSMSMRGLSRLNISFANCALFKPNFINVGVRYLYAEKDLGVSSYENSRYVYRNQFTSIEKTFRDKMREICESEGGVVYTEDLKAMLHLAKNTDEDLKLVNQMLLKYHDSKDEEKLNLFVFGPVLMRMYYYFNQPQLAIESFQNSIIPNSFDYRASFRVLMCLLYKHGMYKEMREIHEKLAQLKGTDFIGPNNVLVFAACLKEDTREAYEFALKYWKIGMNKHSGRCCCIVSYLAIKYNAPEVALEILSAIRKERVITAVNLKLLAYMHLQKYVQMIPILAGILEQDDKGPTKSTLFADVMYEMQEKLNNENAPETEHLMDLLEKIKKKNLIETSSTLQEYLLKPLLSRRRFTKRSEDYSDRSRMRSTRTNRPGLKHFL